jgi:transcriptional antiterminator RfaH
MPILAAEVAQYPDDLFEQLPETDEPRFWWALFTRPRQEKSVARQLLSRQIPFYLPLVAKNLAYRGRRLKSHIPLFSAYLFMYGTDAERTASLGTNRLAGVLPVPDGDQLVRDLAQLRQLIASKAPLTVESRLLPGRRVRIRSGPMLGIEGTVVSRLRETRLVLAVNFLQRGVSVEVDDFILEPLD